jgi:hypothetical protein
LSPVKAWVSRAWKGWYGLRWRRRWSSESIVVSRDEVWEVLIGNLEWLHSVVCVFHSWHPRFIVNAIEPWRMDVPVLVVHVVALVGDQWRLSWSWRRGNGLCWSHDQDFHWRGVEGKVRGGAFQFWPHGSEIRSVVWVHQDWEARIIDGKDLRFGWRGQRRLPTTRRRRRIFRHVYILWESVRCSRTRHERVRSIASSS